MIKPALAAVAALLLLTACERQDAANQRPEPGDTAVARVAGETVWASDVKRQAVAQGLIGEGEPLDVSSDQFRRTLDEVIDQKLLAREAARLKLDRDPVAKRRLAAARERLLGDILIENVVDKAVNDDAIRALYQEQRRLSTVSEELRARQILVANPVEAAAVRKLLDTGASFEALALQKSTDQATRFNGGDLGYFTLDAMPEAYGAALKEAKPGELVGPFQTDAGWAVMKIEDRRPEAPISMEEARPQIVRFLTYDEIRTLLTKLRQGTKVEVMLARPPAAAQPREPASALPGAPAPTEGGAAVEAPASAPATVNEAANAVAAAKAAPAAQNAKPAAPAKPAAAPAKK
jgi:peptidyl-prolyl cis-trans isomerase C